MNTALFLFQIDAEKTHLFYTPRMIRIKTMQNSDFENIPIRSSDLPQLPGDLSLQLVLSPT